MIISPKLEVIFIHNPKTAGISISRVMKELDPAIIPTLHKHDTPASIPLPFAEYLSFTIVRNPWDRMVSLYHQFWKIRDNYTPKIVPEIEDRSFKYFCMEAHKLPSFAENDELMMIHRSPQLAWVDGVDMVFFYENDLKEIMTKVFDREPWHIPHENVSVRSNYKSYYDAELIDYVGSLFHDDINTFGYKFTGEFDDWRNW